MKNSRSVVRGMIACGLALAMIGSVAAQTATEGSAKVVRIKGQARYTTGNNVWKYDLKVGSVVKPGTVIQTSTDPGSYVDLVIEGDMPMVRAVVNATGPTTQNAPNTGFQAKAEQNTVRIAENSVLGVDKLSSINTGADVVTDTQLDLKAGRIIGNVKKMSAASKYEIKLPNGVAGIKGTFYDISADGVVRVVTGTVVVAYVGQDGNVVTQTVGAGQQFDARTGQISPIPQSVMQELRRITPQGGGAYATPTKFNVGPEIFYVSPVRGKGPPFTPPGPPPVVPPGK